MNNRWYDKTDTKIDVFDKLRGLDDKSLKKVSETLISISNSIKAIKREKNEVPGSIGIDRVKGLYQQKRNRRWYDKNKYLSAAMQSISTLSDDEYYGIIEALELTLSE